MSAKPIVYLPGGAVDWDGTASETFSHLARTGLFYRHNADVVKVMETPGTAPHICKLTPASAVTTFERHMRFISPGGNRVPLKKEQTSILLAAEDTNQLPVLRGLAKRSILRAVDGCLVASQRGYDPHTQLYFLTDPPPVIPFQEAANCIMDELLGDFRFETPSDQGRALASILIPGMKMSGLVSGHVPTKVTEANLLGTGKTFKDKVISAVYGEKLEQVMLGEGGVGSLDESFSQCLSKGNPFIQIDNLRGHLNSKLLEQFATGDGLMDVRAFRIGYTPVEVEKFFVSITSNGFSTSPDFADRCIFIRLVHRGGVDFRGYPAGDLLRHVEANQPHYLGCVFAVIGEWHARGCLRTTERRFRSGFHDVVQSADWIARHLFNLPPIMDGHREIQRRIASKHLGWLRRLCLQVRTVGLQGESLRAARLGSIAIDACLDVPGLTAGHMEDESKVYKAIGTVLAACRTFPSLSA